MTRSYKLSRSASNDPLYLAAFGSASRNERRDKYCDSPSFILKMRRRKLFNCMMESERGYKLLRASAAQYLPPNEINIIVANSASRKIQEHSDDEDEYESNQCRKSRRNKTKTTIRHKAVDRVRQWNEDDMFDYDERHPLETHQQINTYENTCQRRNSSSKPALSQICRTADDSHEAEYDSNEDDTDEEDVFEKDFIRLQALKQFLAQREGSIESDADWFDSYEQDKWSSTGEGSDLDVGIDDVMDLDEVETDDKSFNDYSDDAYRGTHFKQPYGFSV